MAINYCICAQYPSDLQGAINEVRMKIKKESKIKKKKKDKKKKRKKNKKKKKKKKI